MKFQAVAVSRVAGGLWYCWTLTAQPQVSTCSLSLSFSLSSSSSGKCRNLSCQWYLASLHTDHTPCLLLYQHTFCFLCLNNQPTVGLNFKGICYQLHIQAQRTLKLQSALKHLHFKCCSHSSCFFFFFHYSMYKSLRAVSFFDLCSQLVRLFTALKA